MSYFLDQLVNGLSLGGVYALIALGFAMVYGVLRLLNFAHAEVFTAGTFIGYFSLLWLVAVNPHWPLINVLASFILAGVGAGLLAVLIERIGYRPIRHRPKVAALLTAVGISILLQDLGIHMFSAHTRGFPPVALPISARDFALVVLVISFAFLYYLVYRTDLGIRMRAVAESPKIAEMMGIDSNLYIVLAFFLGGFFAGIAGVIWGLVYGTVNPQMGFYPGLKAFIIAVVGGVGNLNGTFLLGIGLGVAETMVSGYLPPALSAYKDPLIFILLLAALVRRPTGIFGSAEAIKV